MKAALGSGFDGNFRVWFTDHALHGDVERQFDPTHTVSYLGVLQQALRDLSAWVEKGVAPRPARSTGWFKGKSRRLRPQPSARAFSRW